MPEGVPVATSGAPRPFRSVQPGPGAEACLDGFEEGIQVSLHLRLQDALAWRSSGGAWRVLSQLTTDQPVQFARTEAVGVLISLTHRHPSNEAEKLHSGGRSRATGVLAAARRPYGHALLRTVTPSGAIVTRAARSGGSRS